MHGWLSCDRWWSVQAMIVNRRRLRRVTDLIRLKSLQAIDMKLSIVNSSVTYSELHGCSDASFRLFHLLRRISQCHKVDLQSTGSEVHHWAFPEWPTQRTLYYAQLNLFTLECGVSIECQTAWFPPGASVHQGPRRLVHQSLDCGRHDCPIRTEWFWITNQWIRDLRLETYDLGFRTWPVR